jgi:hypothetical protein
MINGGQSAFAADTFPGLDGPFQKLEHKLAHKPGVTDPAALAAKIGREKLGQKEMTRRSVEGRE